MDLNEHYRRWMHTRLPGLEEYDSAAEIPDDAAHAVLVRTKNSHRGIGTKTSLRELAVYAPNHACLAEVCTLAGLQQLELEYPVTATDLSPLAGLTSLHTLKIDSPRNITDFTPILDLPNLQSLFLTNAKHLHDLEWIRPLKDRLIALGVEGATWTNQTIASLQPLTGFGLQALCLTGTILQDQDLSPIATMPDIRFFHTGINAPRSAFFALRDAKPDLQCDWFREEAWGAFKDPRPPKP